MNPEKGLQGRIYIVYLGEGPTAIKLDGGGGLNGTVVKKNTLFCDFLYALLSFCQYFRSAA